MPISNYGVWAAYPVSFDAERASQDSRSPHIHLLYDDDQGSKEGKFTAAINIKSVSSDSRLVYWINRNLTHPITSELEALSPGFHPLNSSDSSQTTLQGLDYIRSNVLDINKGTLVKHDLPGPNNDIIDFVSPLLTHAISSGARAYLFGQRFSDNNGAGIHDVHMNQGNSGKFARDNGVHQDGGLIFGYDDGHFEAVFLAFAVQKVHTDAEGQPVGSLDFAKLLGGNKDIPKDEAYANQAVVVIRAALVNPVGPDQASHGRGETVFLANRSAKAVSLDGWKISNGKGGEQSLEGTLEGHGKMSVAVPECPLSNKGGVITLLDSEGLKVCGVSYTAKRAQREGHFLYFD